jgi:hypothetical protein
MPKEALSFFYFNRIWFFFNQEWHYNKLTYDEIKKLLFIKTGNVLTK